VKGRRAIKGKEGEEEVARFLRENGYDLLERNFRFSHKEVDIIARKEDIIVFVEVKLRDSERYGSGLEAVTEKKKRNIISVARYFMNKRKLDLNVRFDVASVEYSGIRYIPDAFRVKSVL